MIRIFKKLLGQKGDCDAVKGSHKCSDVLGQCLDCGNYVCRHCGMDSGSIVRHVSEKYCFLSGRNYVMRYKYKKAFRKPDENQ